MRGSTETAAVLEDRQTPVQVKLGAAWTGFVFLYAYVDMLGLYLPGVVEDILAGVVWEFDITQVWASGAPTLHLASSWPRAATPASPGHEPARMPHA